VHVERNNKSDMIPLTTGATGTISNSFTKYLINVPAKHEIKEIAKIKSTLDAAQLLRKVLIYRTERSTWKAP